jgi:hypothetical protein
MLYFPHNVDMNVAEEVIGMVEPLVVVPPTDEDFTLASEYAYNFDGLAPHTGIIMQGIYDQLNMRIKWAMDLNYSPIIMHPGNFYGGSGGQDKALWQMHQGDSVFESGGWYHLATSRPIPFDLPGRWTIGGDFVGNISYGQS